MVFFPISSICETTGYAIRTDNLVGTSPTSTTSFKDPSQGEGLYEVLCGTSHKQAIEALEKDGRVVNNLLGYILGLCYPVPYSNGTNTRLPRVPIFGIGCCWWQRPRIARQRAHNPTAFILHCRHQPYLSQCSI
jgi:hypothetical protein